MRPVLFFLLLLLPLQALAEDAKVSTLTVHGEAVTKVTPDQVTLPVTVREENPSLKAAKEKHDEKLRKLLSLAADTGIAKDKMKTGYMSITPLYDYNRDNSHPHLRGYQVQTSVDFTLTDISKLANFMNQVIEADISEVGSVSYSLQDDEKIKDATLNKALENAYTKASHLAATAHTTLGMPLDIEEGAAEITRPFPPRPMRMQAMALGGAMASAPPELPEGLIEVHQDVTVTYQIKP